MQGLTLDEIISTLQHSSLPTVFIEGKEDLLVYRTIEESFLAKGFNYNFLPCEGRSTLTSLHERRKEFSNIKCAFIADTDLNLFIGVPIEWKNIKLSSGYSVENDLISEYDLCYLFSLAEKTEFEDSIELAAKYFAIQLYNLTSGLNHKFRVNIHELINRRATIETEYFTNQTILEPLFDLFKDYPLIFMRGHTIFSIYVGILSAPTRASKYSYGNILELCAKNAKRYLQEIETFIITQCS